MNCIVKDNEKWSKCLDHINHDGVHGEYKCKWIIDELAVDDRGKNQQICTNPKYKDMFTNKDFEL